MFVYILDAGLQEDVLMTSDLQDGIYYHNKAKPGSSMCTLFLSVQEGSTADEVAEALSNIWTMYHDLKNGIIPDLHLSERTRYRGGLSVLLGYGPAIFDVNGVTKKKPKELAVENFLNLSNPGGGAKIGERLSLTYADHVMENAIGHVHILLQIIGESQLVTHRALIETWKFIKKFDKPILSLRTFYTGFNRPDRRGWLGFHDGISNIKSSERLRAISVSKVIDPEDFWTKNGTYLAYIKIEVDLEKWDKIPVKCQERLIGRDKMTGCPLVGVDKNDNNIPIMGCPVNGTTDITEFGNEIFREHPPYGRLNLTSLSDEVLKSSHVARMYPKDLYNKPQQFRIFRQGFEFLDNSDKPPYFRAGLNFISFQPNVKDFTTVLRYGFGDSMIKCEGSNLSLSDFFKVHSLGFFFVPGKSAIEKFPGEEIFSNRTNRLGFSDRRFSRPYK